MVLPQPKSISNPFKKFERDIRRGIERLADSVKKSINELGDKVRHDVIATGHQVEREVKSSITDTGAEIKHDLTTAQDRLEGDLRETANEIEAGWRTAQEHLVREISRKSIGEVLDVIDDVRHIALPNEVSVTLGPVSVNITDVNEKIDHLRAWADNPPGSKSEVRRFIADIVPSSISVSAEVGLALMLVQSDSLSVGAAITWTSDNCLAIYDAVAKRL